MERTWVSILNNDDNPSFTVRSSTPRPALSRHHSSSSYASDHHRHQHQPQPQQQQYPFDPVRGTSPGSSVGSHDYATSSCGSYIHPTSESYAYASTTSETPRSTTSADPPSPSSVSTSRDSSSTTTTTTTTASTPTSKRGIRKNKYPCPYAASHGCSSTFTTSGHAARHGKKHTGEKSVHCPVCDKAFTRKDNMKQHIRTHRGHSEDVKRVQHQRSISQSPQAQA